MSTVVYGNSSTVNFTSGGVGGLAIPGVTTAIITNKGYGASLGGGIRGIMPQATVDTDKDFKDYEQIRFTLRNAWNTKYITQLQEKKRIVTPFRAVNNAGDVLCRKYYSCGGPCQTFQSRPGMFGLKGAFGAIQSRCDGTGVPPSSCNGKYVYDSSDYITYLKQVAMNKNYNDVSNGGNNSSGSQSAIRAVRRY
jgi:hypothetical protein